MSVLNNSIAFLFLVILLINTCIVVVLFTKDPTFTFREIKITKIATRTQFRLVEPITKNLHKESALPDSKLIEIKAISSKTHVYVAVDNVMIYKRYSRTSKLFRGIHVIVINQFNGRLMTADLFDTYSDGISGQLLVEFLDKIQNGRIIVLVIGDDGSRSLEKDVRMILMKHGSVHVEKLKFRSTWVFTYIEGFGALNEDYRLPVSFGFYAKPSFIRYQISLKKETSKCKWSENNGTRSYFCSKYEGYGSLCRCHNPDTIQFKETSLRVNQTLPIIVMASNRPRYLYRMLLTLLQTDNVKREHIDVFIDGFFDEPTDVAKLLNVSFINNVHVCKGACGISHNYKRSIRYTFDKYKHTKYVLILEEYLEVSPDIMDYFHQLLPILETDESVFCISAWNDLGYKHSSNDSSLLYRVELFPGLGWILKRKIFEDELEPSWPSPNTTWNWDVWLRLNMMKGRECVIPDVSRTYHYGVSGVNMNPHFHTKLFQNHALNKKTGIRFDIESVQKDTYEMNLHREIKSAEIVDHSKDPCKDKDFIPNTENHTYVFYIHFSLEKSNTWKRLAECFKLWSLSPRAYHKEMFRFWLMQNKIFVVGSTSPYAVYMPDNVTPYFLPDK